MIGRTVMRHDDSCECSECKPPPDGGEMMVQAQPLAIRLTVGLLGRVHAPMRAADLEQFAALVGQLFSEVARDAAASAPEPLEVRLGLVTIDVQSREDGQNGG